MNKAPIDPMLDGVECKTVVELILDEVEWVPIDGVQAEDDGIPVATHEGVLRVAGLELAVFRLSDGKRVIEKGSFTRFMEWLGDGE